MAEIDKDGDLPGSDGADLGGLGEDVLSADLEAGLVADLGDDALDEGHPDDAGDPAGDGESEDSGDDSADDGDDGFGGSAFSGGFGGDALFDGLEFDGSGDDSFDFGDVADGGFTPAAGPVSVGGTAGAGSSAGGRGSDHGAAAASGKPSFTASGGHKDKAGRGDHDGESGAFAKANPSDFVSEPHRRSDGKKSNDDLDGGDGTDVIRGFKGADDIDGAAGDDWLQGGHDNDVIDGGAGSDVVDGGKGEDTLVYTLGENVGETDLYDGGKGVDTLRIDLSAEEFETYRAELTALRDWMAENADPKGSTSHGFNDSSFRSGKHPIYQTSFGLTLRNIEELEVNVEGYGVVDLDEGLPDISSDPLPDPLPEPEPDPEPEPKPEPVVVEVAADATTDPGASTVETVESAEGAAISIEAVSVALRPGSQATVSVDVEVRELPPVYDVFLLQDLSGSFWDDLPNVQAQFSGLYDSLTADSDVQFGVGSFIDKPVEYFGWTGDYVYQTHLGVTGDKAALQESLDGLFTRSGYDWKEAQLEGLVQVALRGDEISFRDGAQKFVVLSTDAAFHQEGDYDWAEAGANDYDTEIEDEDYPTIAAVGELLKAAGITPVFAVTEWVADYYQALVDTWGFGSVTLLSSDSGNLSTAITDGLKAAITDLNLSVVGDDFGYVSSMTPELYEDVGAGMYTFDITLEIPSDSADYSSDAMTFVIDGYGEVSVEVEIASVDATGDAGDDTLSGDDGTNGLYGLAGADTLDGRGGDDILEGGAGDDVMTGGAGDDSFVFADGHGRDTITDFLAGSAGGDVIDLRRLTAAAGFTDVMAAAAQVGDDTVIDFGDGNSIALLGVDATQLEEQDFLF